MPDERYHELTPSPRLTRYVECYWWRENAHASANHRVLPDACVDILFSTRHREPLSLNAVGLMTTPLQLDIEAGQSFFGVRFRPGMAAAFFHEAAFLNDKSEPLDSFFGPAARILLDKLSEAAGPAQMAAIMEQFLRPLDPPDAAQRALWYLPDTTLPLDRVVSDAGLSERHFRRTCLERAGVSPKYLRRILRFRQAVDLIRAAVASPAQPSWAQLAAACHYYDQAHLIRDFQEFARCTPGRFFQSLQRPVAVESGSNEPIETRKSDRLH